MTLLTNHKIWWLLLIAGTIVVSILTSAQVQPLGLFFSVLAHMLFAIVVAIIPWLVYWLLGKPLDTEQMMATITVGWLLLAVANLSV